MVAGPAAGAAKAMRGDGGCTTGDAVTSHTMTGHRAGLPASGLTAAVTTAAAGLTRRTGTAGGAHAAATPTAHADVFDAIAGSDPWCGLQGGEPVHRAGLHDRSGR